MMTPAACVEECLGRPSNLRAMVEMVQVSMDRLLGEGDGFWNPEWEEAGIKPFRPRGDTSDGEDSGDGGSSKPAAKKSSTTAGSAIADRLKKQMSKAKSGDAEETDGESVAGSVMDRVKKNRGVKAEAAEASDDTPAEASDDTPAEEPAADAKPSVNVDLAARIKGRLKSKQANG